MLIQVKILFASIKINFFLMEGAELSTENAHAHFHGTIFSILRALCANQMFLYSVPNLC